MLGAILGDVIGSVYEVMPVKTTAFPLLTPESGPTDDTVLTVAIADALLSGRPYVDAFHDWYARYPHAGWGKTFARWAAVRDRDPYGSFGNGSAMGVSPVAWAFDGEADVLAEAERSARVTHDHPEGIAAAQAVALAIWLARTGADKPTIRARVAAHAGYDLGRTLAEIRPAYRFQVYAIWSVPEAIIAFLEADSVEGAIRNAVSLGGDADTQACIAGAIAEAFHGGVPGALVVPCLERCDPPMRDVAMAFHVRFVSSRLRSRSGP